MPSFFLYSGIPATHGINAMLCPYRAKGWAGMPLSQGVALGCYVKAFQALHPAFMCIHNFHKHLKLPIRISKLPIF